MMELEPGIVPGECVLHAADSTVSVIFDIARRGHLGTLSLELDGRNVATLAGAGVIEFTNLYKKAGYHVAG